MALNGRKEKANPTELFIYLNGNSLILIGEAALFKMAFRTSIRNRGLETAMNFPCKGFDLAQGDVMQPTAGTRHC